MPGLSILHVVAPAEVGGLERVVQSLAAGSVRRGHRVGAVAVLDLGQGPHPFVEALTATGTECFPIRLAARAYGRERAHLREVCGRFRPDVIHTHGYRPDILAGTVARRQAIPIVSTAHGFIGNSWKGKLYEWLERRSLRRFDGVAAVSRPLLQMLERSGVPAGRLHLIRNGWGGGATLLDRTAARQQLGVSPAGFRVGCVGRISREKGPDVMIDALALLKDRPIALSLIGGGPERAPLEARAEALGVADRITWHGVVPDAGRLLPAFDAFALTSRTEGTPMVLFEAMEAGVPIVATAVGGVPDVISPSEGKLIGSEAPQELADALREIESRPQDAALRISAARQRLQSEFGLTPWLEQYEALYRRVLGR